MAQNPASSAMEAERAELETLAEALTRSPRLARLLRYLGEKYFAGETDQLHEYNIATEVFDRSKTTFDAGEDAIARVEAHRLRKRLKVYYETEGKDHPIQIWLPSGTYVPVFAGQSENLPFEPEASLPAADLPETPESRPATRSRTVLISLACALILLLLGTAFGVYRLLHPGVASHSPSSSAVDMASPKNLPASSANLPIRILSGYSGRPQIDSSGAAWQADHFNFSGGVWRRTGGTVARTSDPMIFEQWRTGDFFYNIPLPPGVYELHLYFANASNPSDAMATFSVSINDDTVLRGFDINSDALGDSIADEKVFRDVSPTKDGYLHLGFTSERGAPSLNAIEVLPGIPHKQLPIRLITQTTPFTDHDGNVWHPDTYFMNGRLADQRRPIAGSLDPDLFATERYGHFTYAIPVDTRGRYTVILHFAEFYFGPHASGVGGTGSRLFRVFCNGNTLLDNFDIYKEAGSLNLLTKSFTHIKPTAQGKLNLTFEPIVNNATVSGIEVIEE